MAIVTTTTTSPPAAELKSATRRRAAARRRSGTGAQSTRPRHSQCRRALRSVSSARARPRQRQDITGRNPDAVCVTHRCILSGYNRSLCAAAMGPSVVAEVKALAAFVEEHCSPIIGSITHAASPTTPQLQILAAAVSTHEERVSPSRPMIGTDRLYPFRPRKGAAALRRRSSA